MDASLSGFGAQWGRHVYATPILRDTSDLSIVHLEMLNIIIALKTWGRALCKHRVIIHCDNWAVTQVV